MTVIITMAGLGSRFTDRGYRLPKHMIQARGKALFEWSLLSLADFYECKFIFACLAEHDLNWIKKSAQNVGIGDVSVIPRVSVSRGQAETAYDIMDCIPCDHPIVIANIDTYIKRGIFASDIGKHDGTVYVVKSSNPGLSYVKYTNDGFVSDVVEKQVISEWATVGVYGFKSCRLFANLYRKAYHDKNIKEVQGERYIAPMYRYLLDENGSINTPILAVDDVNFIGTPSELQLFESKAPSATKL